MLTSPPVCTHHLQPMLRFPGSTFNRNMQNIRPVLFSLAIETAIKW